MQDVGGADFPTFTMRGMLAPILFAHATGFLPWLWHPVIKQLVPQNKIWVPYICNYRECDPEKGGLSWDIWPKIYYCFPVLLTLKILWLSDTPWAARS